jgi:NodT family efflux transporter outer membrane factor (OMF) lipoprotein
LIDRLIVTRSQGESMLASLIVMEDARTCQLSKPDALPRRRRRGRGLLLFPALVLMLSGCGSLKNWYDNGFKVGPNYGRPTALVADAWLDAYDQRVRSELPNNPLWWEVFDDPRLSELVQSTYEQNLTLRSAGMRVLQARAMRGVAVGGLFPQSQEAFGSYRRDQLSTTTAGIGKLVGKGFPISRVYDTWTAGFDAYWELDIWGRFRRNIEAADAELDASIEDYDAVLIALLAETAATYVEYRTAQEQLDFARANVKTQEGSLKIAQDKFKGGVYSELDVTQPMTNLRTTEQLVPLFEARIRDANLRLCTLMGVPPRDLAPELGTGPIPAPGANVAVGVPADLLRRRPDVRAAERRVAAQSARIGVATADLFPHFGITGSIRVDAERFKDLFSQASTAGVISPGFAWDVLNYGRLINTVRTQDARFQDLAYQYQGLVLSANEEVESAINNFLNAQERLKSAEETVAASQRSVEIIQLQSEKGAVDMNRVFTLQRALVQDQDRLASTRGEVALYLIAVYKAIGGGWEIRQGGVPTVVAQMDQPVAVPAEVAPSPTEAVPSPTETLGTETE